MDARPATENPLGLNLDFLYGRGYLWAEHTEVSDWVTLERLRMEIPDLTFPFDVRGGLARFRDTRCLLREVDLRISETGLVEAMRGVVSDLDGFSDLDIRFLDDVILVAVRFQADGTDSFVTFRLGAIATEPGADVVRLLAHEFRAYGPLALPVRQLVNTLLQHAIESERVAALGHSTSFAAEFADDSVVLRPLKMLLLHVFAERGWKLPSLAQVVVGDLLCQPGGAVLRARAADEHWTPDRSSRRESALADDDVGSRLDGLLEEPTPTSVAEAERVCDDIEQRDDRSITAAMARARIAELTDERAEAVDRWKLVSEILKERGETLDRTLCDVMIARHVAHTDPEAAISRLTEALRDEPRNRAALQELRAVYRRTGQHAELEDVLKRLTGVAADPGSLGASYVDLARHLMTQQGQIGEARAFLERGLRIAPHSFEILDALGETWVRSGEPARAVNTLGSAATAARQRGDLRTASRLLFRIGQLWEESLGNTEQALMQVRRALEFWSDGGVNDPLALAEQLRYAARLCEEDRQHSEAVAYWTEALAALQLAEARVGLDDRVEVRRALATTHRDIAAAYRARGRHDVAANHERRLVEMDPTDVEALDAMEAHHRGEGGIVAFADALAETVQRVGATTESLALRTRLAERLRELDRIEDSIDVLEEALTVAPGAEQVRKLLAAALVETNQPERLAQILTSVHQRVQQRDVQWTVLMELGDLSLDVLGDPEAAARAYSEAASLLPARRDAYTRCRVALEWLASESDWANPSPLGGPLGRDLLGLWQQLAISAPTTEERSRVRSEVAELVEAIGIADEGGEPPMIMTSVSESWTDIETLEISRIPVVEATPQVQEFREQYDKTIRRPPSLPDLTELPAESPLARILQRRARRVPTAAELPALADPIVPPEPPPAVSTDELERAVSDARKTGDDDAIAGAVRMLLEHGELAAERRLDLTFELAELLYYELEDGDGALDWLLEVRRLDPLGYGARPGVLNAIEAIYEERGSIDGQVEILKARLEQAQSDDMRDTYRLLLAQLEWEDRADRAAARAWLTTVLDRDDRHEGARRLLADIAEDSGEWAQVAEHLKIALTVAGEGLDSVELEKRLAAVYLDRLGAPDDALRHFRNVLEDAPQDAGAMDAIRRCQAALGDWDAVLASLRRELEMMLGRAPDPDSVDWLDSVDASSVSPPLRIPASHVLADIARVLQDELNRPTEARELWTKVAELWPEHLEAVERRIDLDRKLEHHGAKS